MGAFENISKKDLEAILKSTLTQSPFNIIFERKDKKRTELIPKKKVNNELYVIELDDIYILAVFSFQLVNSKILESP